MSMKHALGLTTLAALLALVTMAEGAGFGVGAKIGTLGFGGEATLGFTPHLSLRFAYNAISADLGEYELDDGDGEDSADKISAELDFQTYGLLLDWHPAGTGFRISAGAFVNDNRLRATAEPGDTIEINDTEYKVRRFDGEATFDSFSPYVGIGYGNAAGEDGHWHFVCDFGVLFQGAPSVDLSATADDPLLQLLLNADLEAEEEDVEDDVEGFTAYPVVSLGAAYSF